MMMGVDNPSPSAQAFAVRVDLLGPPLFERMGISLSGAFKIHPMNLMRTLMPGAQGILLCLLRLVWPLGPPAMREEV